MGNTYGTSKTVVEYNKSGGMENNMEDSDDTTRME